MTKRKAKPLWIVSEWITDQDKRVERLLTLLVIILAIALWLGR